MGKIARCTVQGACLFSETHEMDRIYGASDHNQLLGSVLMTRVEVEQPGFGGEGGAMQAR